MPTRGGDADEEGEEEERDDGEQSAGGHNLNDHHNNDSDDDDDDDEEEEEVVVVVLVLVVVVLADVYLAKTVCKWPLVDTQILRSLTHLQIIEQNLPLLQKTSRYCISKVSFTNSFNINSIYHPHWQLNLWIAKATSASTCLLWPSTMLPVTFVESVAWLGNASMQHHNGANFMYLIMILPSLSPIPMFLEWVGLT